MLNLLHHLKYTHTFLSGPHQKCTKQLLSISIKLTGNLSVTTCLCGCLHRNSSLATAHHLISPNTVSIIISLHLKHATGVTRSKLGCTALQHSCKSLVLKYEQQKSIFPHSHWVGKEQLRALTKVHWAMQLQQDRLKGTKET